MTDSANTTTMTTQTLSAEPKRKLRFRVPTTNNRWADIARDAVKAADRIEAKAQCTAFACSHFWDRENPRDADWDHQHVRSLVESILKRAGLQLPWEG